MLLNSVMLRTCSSLMCIDCCRSICCFTIETSAFCIILPQTVEIFFVSEPNECYLVSIYSGGVPNCMRWVCRRATKLVYSNAFSGECFFRARSSSNFRFFEKISEQGAAAATCNFFREELEGREAAAARAPPAAGEKQKHELDRL